MIGDPSTVVSVTEFGRYKSSRIQQISLHHPLPTGKDLRYGPDEASTSSRARLSVNTLAIQLQQRIGWDPTSPEIGGHEYAKSLPRSNAPPRGYQFLFPLLSFGYLPLAVKRGCNYLSMSSIFFEGTLAQVLRKIRRWGGRICNFSPDGVLRRNEILFTY